MQFEIVKSDGMNLIKGECPNCKTENALIIMSEKQIRKTRTKINLKCVLCKSEYYFTAEKEDE